MTIPSSGRSWNFIGGSRGPWRISTIKPVVGPPLPLVDRLDIRNEAPLPNPEPSGWVLRGVTSNVRYVTRKEMDQLQARPALLGRQHSSRAALIPIRKSAAWWNLGQDERRRIFEEQSHHTAIGLRYLPEIARRLHHCRDLGSSEPFDFLTWFEYAPEHAGLFEDLVGALRDSEEWKYVDREVDIRLMR